MQSEQVSHLGRSCPACGARPSEPCMSVAPYVRRLFGRKLGYVHEARTAFVSAGAADLDALLARVSLYAHGAIDGVSEAELEGAIALAEQHVAAFEAGGTVTDVARALARKELLVALRSWRRAAACAEHAR